MERPFTPKVLTANDLLEGDVVYLAASGKWTRELCEAKPIDNQADADAELRRAMARPGDIVEPYLIDVAVDADGPRPTHFRETFRSRGPTNYSHGKQARV